MSRKPMRSARRWPKCTPISPLVRQTSAMMNFDDSSVCEPTNRVAATERPRFAASRHIDRRRVVAALERLAETNYGDTRQLTGIDPPEWRLRVGDYRVRFRYDQEFDERT